MKNPNMLNPSSLAGAATDRPCPIAHEANSQERHLGRTADLISRLTERISPVLSGATPTDSAQLQKAEPLAGDSPFALLLRERNSRLANYNDELESLIQRIEL